MRFLIALLLAIAIPFNAAYAAGAGVCDVLEGQARHGEHLGHHSHAHDHEHGEVANTDPAQPGSDHNHSHAHPLLSWMLPAQVGIHLPVGVSAAPPLPAKRFVSATPARLERPPRAASVA
ncbi:MAG: hypothetical protein Q8L56_10745 [Rhodocyclaceae bacterium]|nr:hypothetical protein [Rhodocyclaceae bacterium]